MRVGKSVVDLYWKVTDGRVTLDVNNSGPAFRLSWTQASMGSHAASAVLERDIPLGKARLGLPVDDVAASFERISGR